MPVGVLLRTVDSAELTEWMAHLLLDQEDKPGAKPAPQPGARLPPIDHAEIRRRASEFIKG